MTALFDQKIAQTDKDIKQREARMARQAFQRKLQNAYDSAVIQETEAEHELHEMYDFIGDSPQRGVNSFDVNDLVNCRSTISACQESRAIIAAEYQLLFGEPLPNSIEEEVTE